MDSFDCFMRYFENVKYIKRLVAQVPELYMRESQFNSQAQKASPSNTI